MWPSLFRCSYATIRQPSEASVLPVEKACATLAEKHLRVTFIPNVSGSLSAHTSLLLSAPPKKSTGQGAQGVKSEDAITRCANAYMASR